MTRSINKLSAISAKSLVKPGRHSDGGGLYLHITQDAASTRRRWIFRYVRNGRTTELGLGGGRDLPLASARAEAAQMRLALAQGLDPKVERDRAKTGSVSFGDYAAKYIEGRRSGWRNAKHAEQWTMTVTKYAAPLHAKPVDQMSTDDVLAVLQPRWNATPETAKRLQSRIEAILDAAKAQGLRTGDNPARWRGHLDQLLTKRGKLTRGHHSALPFSELPEFMADVAARDAIAARAMEFLILTASRTSEVLLARWEEISLERSLWTLPAERMKAGKEHRVALSSNAISILEALGPTASGLIFSKDGSKPLSNMALLMLLRRMKRADLTAHGFRSTFKDWASEVTSFPSEMSEMALAHAVGNKVEAAYRRGDMFEKRLAMMEAWARFATSGKANVVSIAPAHAA